MSAQEITQFESIKDYVERFGFDVKPNSDFYILRYEEITEHSNIYVNSFRNNFFEISLDLSSGCPYVVDNFKCESDKNRLNIISPFRLQSIYPAETNITETLKGYSLFFNSEFLNINLDDRSLINWLPFIGHKVSPILQLNDDSVKEFMFLFERIIFHQNQKDIDSKIIVKHYISIILLLVKKYHHFKPIESLTREQEIFAEFQQLLECHFLEFTSVKQFAHKLHLSTNHFSETIKKICGKTPIQLINEKKIDFAKSLLLQSNMTLKKIASELQFENENYFYSLFKRISGLTPTQYRNK